MTLIFLIAQAVAEPEGISYGASFAKMIAAMIFIIALAFVVLKFLLPKIVTMRRNRDSEIEVLDYQPLEPRKGVYLIKIADKKIAVGVTDHAIATLTEWHLDGEKK